jgi:carbon monoxide dehydrogenase subunit G
MRAYTFKEYIDRPPRDVWNVVVDLSIAPKWRPLVKSMETEDGLPVHAGSRVRLVVEYLGRRSTHVSSTTAFEPERRWALYSGDNASVEGWFDFRLEPEGAGTRVVTTCDLKAHRFLAWLFLPLIARGERQRRVELLPNLKRFVEGEASSTTGTAPAAQ